MKTTKLKEKGITLIALVITIVVLIILATISINMVLGDDGIIQKAEKSKELYQNAAKDEETQLGEWGDKIQEHIPPVVYEKYEKGQAAKIGNTYFYVIEDSDETQETVTLLAKNNIANDVEFSEAEALASEYGTSLGGTGRLPMYDECSGLCDLILCGDCNRYGEAFNYYLGDSEEGTFKYSISSDIDYADESMIVGRDSYYTSEYNGVRPVIVIHKNKVTPIEFGFLDKVKVGEELFYVLEDSEKDDENLTLLAAQSLDLDNLVQSTTPDTTPFSETIYWEEAWTEITEDETPPDEKHYAARAAYDYGEKLGGNGRLATEEEGWRCYYDLRNYFDSVVFRFAWIASSGGFDENVLLGRGGSGLGDTTYYYEEEEVQPVVEIAKDKVTLLSRIDKDFY